jgi:ATP-dependent protease ClpP protease subunit
MIFGDIGASWDDKSVEAATFVRDLQNVEAKTLNVRINSRGGSVYDGTAIHNALKRHPAAVNVSVEGVALSIASLIAMAGDTINMPENSLMMIHAPWAVIAIGNSKDLRETANVLDKMGAAMATSYASKSGISERGCARAAHRRQGSLVHGSRGSRSRLRRRNHRSG